MDGPALAAAVSRGIETLVARWPAGYVEVLASVSVQVVYLLFGFLVEAARPPYESETYPRMFVDSLRNHVAATLVHVAYVWWRGGAPVLTRTFLRPYALPSWTEVVAHLVVGLLLRDVVFYAIHRLWHAPGVYEVVHAKHHEVARPRRHHVLTISYMTVVDFMFLYGLPVVAVAKLLEMDIVTTVLFSFVSAVGEQIKLAAGDEGHDAHHADPKKGELGVYGFMDAIFSGLAPAAKKVD